MLLEEEIGDMRIIIFSTIFKEKNRSVIQEVFDTLFDSDNDLNIYVYAPFLEMIKGEISFKRDVGSFDGYLDLSVKTFDYVISLGGDGTILTAATHIRDYEIPIMGINLGRLGFLASIEKSRVKEAISLLLNGRYNIENRTTLFLESNHPIFGDSPFALNDFTLLKRDTSSMITIHTYVNGTYLNSYWADGLVVATPTGSTAYSLSCGGPIIFPNSGNFVVTPVAPHNLNVRPIVVADDSVLSFVVEGRSEHYLCTLDSRTEIIDSKYELAIRKNDFDVKVIQLQDTRFIKSLHAKLGWGIDKRN